MKGRKPKLNWSKRFGWNCTINKKRYYLGRDKKDAEKEFAELVHKHYQGELFTEDTVVNLIDQYLYYKEKMVAPLSYAWYERPLKEFKRYIGTKKKMASLAKSDLELFIVERWSKRLDGKTLSANTVRQAKLSIKGCFKWLQDNRKITFNPFVQIKVGKYDAAKVTPTPEQLQKLLDHFKHDQDMIDLLSFESLTGARVWERGTLDANK